MGHKQWGAVCPTGTGVTGRDGGGMQLSPTRYKQLLECAGVFLFFIIFFPLLSLQITDGVF